MTEHTSSRSARQKNFSQLNAKQLAHEFGVPPITIRYILRAKYKQPGEKRRTWNFTEAEANEVREYVATVLGRKPRGAQ